MSGCMAACLIYMFHVVEIGISENSENVGVRTVRFPLFFKMIAAMRMVTYLVHRLKIVYDLSM